MHPTSPPPHDVPLRHMCAAGPTGNCKAWKYFPNIFPCTQTNTCVCQAHTYIHTHIYAYTCIFTCIFIYKHARAFAVSKQRHKRRRGRERSRGRVGEAPQVKCSIRRGAEKRTEYRGKNHDAVAAGVDVDCGTLRQDAKFNFTCGK